MKTGDVVRWSSQSAGVTKEKQGEIVAVVGPDLKVSVGSFPDLFVDHILPGEFGGARDHTSYLVSVPPTGTGKPSLYWPIVSKLQVVSDEEESTPDELPGIPPPGPLHNAMKKFVQQRERIEKEKEALKSLGDDVLKAMEEEKKPSLSISVAGETYVFKITSASARLKMTKARKEKVSA